MFGDRLEYYYQTHAGQDRAPVRVAVYLGVEDVVHLAVGEVGLGERINDVDEENAERDEDSQPQRHSVGEDEDFKVGDDNAAGKNSHSTGHKIKHKSILADSKLLAYKTNIDQNKCIDKSSGKPEYNGSKIKQLVFKTQLIQLGLIQWFFDWVLLIVDGIDYDRNWGESYVIKLVDEGIIYCCTGVVVVQTVPKLRQT